MKTLKITYWSSTIILSLFFVINIFMYFTKNPHMVNGIKALGYPVYLLDILGTAKALGIIVLLFINLPRLKEWAYAGFTIDLIGAMWSHIATGEFASVGFVFVWVVILGVSYISMRKLQAKGINPKFAGSVEG